VYGTTITDMKMELTLSVYQSVCLSVCNLYDLCMSVSVCVCVTVCVSVSVSVSLSVLRLIPSPPTFSAGKMSSLGREYLSVCLSVCVTVCVCLCAAVYVSEVRAR